ncbi:hypothetical protein Dacet_3003 [Denitrovibrio acetiphilus DSM 12809]|uniref:Uncharacterized protein n=1 Tax=Denitrovibrio acetiphilus (strain DSM 12809 / NBRC 114555 / N2460) TaxID=522772 RepID=D4H749_DENA2|nr:hypothetical protein Dacet_3003 [Denitrovibrio acetiphilus DSM 12809]
MTKLCGGKAEKKQKRFTCSKCGATANKKDNLCRPVK